MANLPQQQDANLLVGFDHSDDAGVYRLNDDLALIHTADFITPPVDDPFIFGQIAAANAISDVYAMGGRPLTCLNLVGFPQDKLETEILHQIILGAMNKIQEAGAVLVGGHSTVDEEPKFGLAVTGTVHPQKIWRNGGAKVGDALILTKPIGSGVLLNANRKGWVSKNALRECIETMITLNKSAKEVMEEFDIHCATDVTGFGLCGHALEIARASGVALHLNFNAFPQLPESLAMYQRGVTTGVNEVNHQLVSKDCHWDAKLQTAQIDLTVDPQTNGGLLFALPAPQANLALKKLHEQGLNQAAIVGRVEDLTQTHLYIHC